MSLSVYDIRDMDLMLHLTNGGATASQLAEEMGLGEGGSRHVGTRFAWMHRFGMLHLDLKSRLWSLSPGGERVVESKRRATRILKLESVPDEEMIEVMAHVTSRFRLGDPMNAAMLRREFQYGTSPRRK